MADKFDLSNNRRAGTQGTIPAIRASPTRDEAWRSSRRKTYLGGTCLNWGCIPTKALLQSPPLMLNNVKHHGEQFGIMADGVEFDFSKANEHKDQVVGQLQKGVQGLMKKNKIHCVSPGSAASWSRRR